MIFIPLIGAEDWRRHKALKECGKHVYGNISSSTGFQQIFLTSEFDGMDEIRNLAQKLSIF